MPAARKPSAAQPAPVAEEPARPRLTRRSIACLGCCGAAALVLLIGIVVLNAWDARDSRLSKGKPLPGNVGYIGRWVSDGQLSARVDVFAIAGDKIVCDFGLRNDTSADITVSAVGRTLIAPPLDARLGQTAIELELMPGDQPMRVTDNTNILGLLRSDTGEWLMAEPPAGDRPEPPGPLTLKPHETKQVRYRPKMESVLMPASALRLAVLANDGKPPHAFYFLRHSAGIAGLFEALATPRGQ